MTTSSNRMSTRVREFYETVFYPRYQNLLKIVRQTPLVIILWGPRHRSSVWNAKRQQMRDLLTQWGHAVYLDEQLERASGSDAKHDLASLSNYAADLIVGVQATYGAVAPVEQFADFRVIDSKLLLFVDAAATDQAVYRQAVAELQACYNNIETWSSPRDLVQDHLIKKILAKVGMMQMVKYFALHNAASWGIYSANEHPAALFPYNLLELYRYHRAEIDTLGDSVSLFILAYLNSVSSMTLNGLARQFALTNEKLEPRIAQLVQGELITLNNGIIAPTDFGKRILDQAGLAATALPVGVVAKPLRRANTARIVSLAFMTTFLIATLALYWSSTARNALPLEYTPDRPLPTATSTYTPTPYPTPTALR